MEGSIGTRTQAQRTKQPVRTRKRLNPEEREAQIVTGAVRFFARHGLEGKTRDLARQLGITQPLLYRYFPSKESLIERVYQEVFVRRWNVDWNDLVIDRNRPLDDRLCQFYREYSHAIYDYDWIRIFIFSGLKGVDINARYLKIVREKLLFPVCGELRHMIGGLPEPDALPITQGEVELVWGLHGAFFYRAVRRFVYGIEETQINDQVIENDVHNFLIGAPDTIRRIVGEATAAS